MVPVLRAFLFCVQKLILHANYNNDILFKRDFMNKKADITDYPEGTFNSNKTTDGLEFARNVPSYLGLNSGILNILKPKEKIQYLRQIEEIKKQLEEGYK
jgi:hypothetical protein